MTRAGQRASQFRAEGVGCVVFLVDRGPRDDWGAGFFAGPVCPVREKRRLSRTRWRTDQYDGHGVVRIGEGRTERLEQAGTEHDTVTA